MTQRQRFRLSIGAPLALVTGWVVVAPAAQQPTAPAGAAATIAVQGRSIPNTLDEILNPAHTAVIVHEMLNDFISPGGGYDKRGRRYDPARMATIVPPIQKLLATARAKNVRVIYVRYTTHADGSTESDPQRQRYLGRGATPLAPIHIDGQWGWEVIDDVKPGPDDLVLRKYRPDAFFGTVLDQILRWNGIRTIVMVGIGGEVGVVPTLMTAENLGYFRVALSDGILSSNPARMDDAMKYVADHAIVKSHSEVVDSWNKSTPAATVAVAPGSTAPAAITYHGRPIPNAFDEIVNPKHTVLLVHEMLNDFISPGGGYDKAGRRYDPARMATIVPSIQKLLAAARAKKVRVVYVRYTSLPDGVTSSDPDLQRSANSTRPMGPLTVDGTWGWEVIDAVKPAAGDVVVRKYRPDAFFGTILAPVLRWNGIKTVVMVGIGGEIGVVPTLMHAENLGLFTVAIKDGILSSNPARMEDAMRFIQDHATMKTHQEVLAAWDKYPVQSSSAAERDR